MGNPDRLCVPESHSHGLRHRVDPTIDKCVPSPRIGEIGNRGERRDQ